LGSGKSIVADRRHQTPNGERERERLVAASLQYFPLLVPLLYNEHNMLRMTTGAGETGVWDCEESRKTCGSPLRVQKLGVVLDMFDECRELEEEKTKNT